jgi:hypothetical protein
MIGDDVNHQVHSSVMQSGRESNQISFGSEIAVEGIDVLSPVSMVGFSIGTVANQIIYNRRDPDLVLSVQIQVFR